MKLPEIAIVGCGAVTEIGYLPGVRSFPDVRVTWLVDLDQERARSTAERFGISNWTTDLDKALDKVDMALLATAPASHAALAERCFERDVHVLCEKPLATSYEEARGMVDGASSRGLHLGVVRNLRSAASSHLTKWFLSERFGRVLRFEGSKGQKLNWPARSSYRTLETAAGGGVLADVGPHLLDLLVWYLGDDLEVVQYTDDNLGGAEANARLELKVGSGSGGSIPGIVDFSFTRNLDNTLRIYGENGMIETSTGGEDIARVYPPEGDDSPHVELRFSEPNSFPSTWKEQMGGELLRFARSVATGDAEYVPAADALPVMRIMDECRRTRRTVLEPWEAKYIAPLSEAAR